MGEAGSAIGVASAGTYSVGWTTLSFINAGPAQDKNRSGLNRWLISLLLGPVATVLIVMWGPYRPVD